VSRGEGELLTVPKPRAVSLSPCALQRSQSESRGPEIGTPGLMSGDGKRGVGHRPQATAPILDSTEPEVARMSVDGGFF
jgi:hypothetical protein